MIRIILAHCSETLFTIVEFIVRLFRKKDRASPVALMMHFEMRARIDDKLGELEVTVDELRRLIDSINRMDC